MDDLSAGTIKVAVAKVVWSRQASTMRIASRHAFHTQSSEKASSRIVRKGRSIPSKPGQIAALAAFGKIGKASHMGMTGRAS
ncbi:MAG: hypothetical protein IKG52_06800 [Rhodobacteraceae bacterium]|nr:hypothetical protein [Paracoccaceae bacterium]